MAVPSSPTVGAIVIRARTVMTRISILLFSIAATMWSSSSVAALYTISPVIPASGSVTIPQDSSTTLKIFYGSGGFPVGDGTQIDWEVTSEPNSGDGTFTGETSGPPSFVSTDTTDGYAEVTFNVTEPGTYTVRAGYCPEGCFEQYPFTITVEPVIPGGADLSISKSGQPQPVSAGGRLKYLISVANHGPDSARSVTMTDTLPAQVTFASLAAPPNWSCTTPAVGSGGTVTCSKGSMGPRESIDFRVAVDVLPSVPDGSTITNAASVSSGSDDPNAGNDIATATNSVTGSATPGLAKGSGDGQSVPVNTPFPDPLTVIAGGASTDLGRAGAGASSAAFAASGVTINWSVISGSATLSAPSSVTNGSGVASINVTAGPIAGPIVVRAIRADDPSAQVNFNLTATDDDSSLADLPGLTPTQLALAKVLDELCSSPSSGGGSTSSGRTTQSAASLDDLQSRCEDLRAAIESDPDGVIAALDQLFGDIALVQSESALLAMQSQFENIKARIAALRSGTRGTSFGGLAFNTSSGQLPVGAMFQSLLDDDKPTTAEVGTDFSRWGFFAAGTISRGDADQGSLSPGYDFDINGLTVGADYRMSDKLIFGGTMGYTRQSNDLTAREGNLETRGWSASAYATYYRSNSWYSDAVLTYGRNSYETERHVSYTLIFPDGSTSTINQVGRADSNGDSFSLAASFGRDFNKGGWGFGPYLRAIYTRMDFDPLVEEFNSSSPGNGLALVMDTRSVTSLSSTLGGKLTYAHSASWGVLMPHLQLEWQHEFRTDPSAVEAHFLFDPSATPFTLSGDPVDGDFFRLGLGMSFVLTHGRSGFFYYERLISRERFSQNSLAFGLRLEF